MQNGIAVLARDFRFSAGNTQADEVLAAGLAVLRMFMATGASFAVALRLATTRKDKIRLRMQHASGSVLLLYIFNSWPRKAQKGWNRVCL